MIPCLSVQLAILLAGNDVCTNFLTPNYFQMFKDGTWWVFFLLFLFWLFLYLFPESSGTIVII